LPGFIEAEAKRTAFEHGREGRESGAPSALFNMMRNIGCSIGIVWLSTLLSVRERFHSERIGESITVYSGAFQERVQQSAAYFMAHGNDPWSAHMGAIGAIGRIVRRESFLLAYGDSPGARLRFDRERSCCVLHEEDPDFGRSGRALTQDACQTNSRAASCRGKWRNRARFSDSSCAQAKADYRAFRFGFHDRDRTESYEGCERRSLRRPLEKQVPADSRSVHTVGRR
jgi:hypothetical protein